MKKPSIPGLTRISKAKARRLHAAGVPVMLIPCKLRPGEPWFPEGWLSTLPTPKDTFDTAVNAFEYYNCYGSAGRYAAFYVKNERG